MVVAGNARMVYRVKRRKFREELSAFQPSGIGEVQQMFERALEQIAAGFASGAKSISVRVVGKIEHDRTEETGDDEGE